MKLFFFYAISAPGRPLKETFWSCAEGVWTVQPRATMMEAFGPVSPALKDEERYVSQRRAVAGS